MALATTRIEYRLSQSYLGKVLTAATALSLVLSTAAARAETAARHFQLASQFAQQGMLQKAVQEYQRGLALDSNSPDAYNNLGVLYFELGLYSQAADAFRKAYRLRPGDPRIGFNLGLADFKADSPRDAIGPLQAALHSFQHATDAQFLLGTCYFELKQWQKSVAHLEAVRQKRPDDEKILFLLYNDYRNLGDASQALQAATHLIETHPHSSFVYELLGEASDAASKPKQAEHDFNEAIARAPRAPELHFLLGYLYWRWKRYQEAIGPFTEETLISPNFAPPYFYLGDIAVRQGRPKEALEYFAKALKIDPSYVEARLGMGRAYAKLGRYGEAEPLLEQAAKRAPQSVEAHYWLGQTLVRMGRIQDGRKQLEIVNRLHLNQTNHTATAPKDKPFPVKLLSQEIPSSVK